MSEVLKYIGLGFLIISILALFILFLIWVGFQPSCAHYSKQRYDNGSVPIKCYEEVNYEGKN